MKAVQREDNKFTQKQMLLTVSQALGNTPAVCRKSYVHPQMLALANVAAASTQRAAEMLRPALEAGARGRSGLRGSEKQLLLALAHLPELAG